MAGVIPNDPQFGQQWPLHNTGQTGGMYDADIDMPEAWSVTTGNMATVIAILDSGVDYTHPDLYLNIWLNESEIPTDLDTSLTDADSDGLITFRDLNDAANAAHVNDVNANGYIDGGDLVNDARWENGLDDDGNGKVDDLIGWDTHDNDNDPQAVGESHGTDQALIIGAMANNGVGSAGVNWAVRIMPICVQFDPDGRLNVNAAAGLDYAVGEGASISYNRRDNPSDTYSQVMFDAIDRARVAGHLFLGAAGNLSQDMDANPFYPGAYDLDNVLVVAAVDASDKLTSVSSWGLNNVDLGAPTPTGFLSQALAYTTGVAALLKSFHPDWNYAEIKAQILTTVDPVPSLTGKTVTGGRLNAANALGVVQVTPLTKFYVVNDATQNLTYEYAADSSLVESYSLNSGNSAPRGAASTVAGDKAWVIDANKKVFVYNNSGGLQGSWTAGGLASNATVEGIATNGTDVWIVDAKSDKVFKYTGAAGRLSGSQNAASSFSLNSGNRDPKDIVTDGVHLWVVNNSTTDKVFKYTLSGSLIGSWTISSGGGSPTGITIDPANVSDIWIVDNVTDRVYRYTAAASRNSGSQSPATSFALAAGNTNPQGIADPPTPEDGAEHIRMRPNAINGEVSTAAARKTFAFDSHVRSLLHSAAVDQLLSEFDRGWTRKSKVRLHA